MDSSTGDTLPSPENTFASSSGEPILELGGDVFGDPRSHPFADHAPGVDAPGLTMDVTECELGKDLPRWLRGVGAVDAGCCEGRKLSMLAKRQVMAAPRP